ncbi:FAD/NAD(P)-binding protein [Candidatus Woesearchaeota archaeon]|nr:FAD/NAD(P)-binding protein [Candidatus Woesearchaeota archaeon]
MSNYFEHTPVEILAKTWESPDTVTFRVNWQPKHDPGQFIEISIPGVGESPISFCSWNPTYCEFNVRVVGNVTKAISKLEPGDTMHVRGPYGKGYPMDYFKNNHLLFIGGGCGVAPLKGIIEYVQHHRKHFKDVDLYFGYRSRDDILFKHLLEHWEKEFFLHVTIDKDAGDFHYSCPVGFVTQAVQEADIPPDNKIVFLCGPPVMMEKTMPLLLDKGFHEDQIWVSAERHMKCCTGKCGHCMINGKYVCKDGPVFRYDEIKGVTE